MPKGKTKTKYSPEEYIVAIVMTLMLILCFANVLSRYILHLPLLFTDALLGALFPMVTFLGAPIVCMRKRNPAFTLFSDMLPRKHQKYVELLTTIASVILFSFLLYYGTMKTLDYYQYNTTINALNNAPRWIFSVCIPVGALLYIWRTIQVSVSAFKERAISGAEEDER
ncbi:TRAP transporter small permease [Halalkalibacter oceani]|uniref:TRAP transporter small permease n=1 Tax=Halalkalibacter oceani TaxID=1653776 RepID=UPI0033952520